MDNIWILAGVVLVVFLAFIAIMRFNERVINPYKRRTDYLKIEIGRTRGDKQEYWKKCLKEHYMSAIPVVRKVYFKTKK